MTAKIDWYREVLELEPNSKVFFPLARLLAEDGQADEAINLLEKGLDRHPEFLEARLYLIELLHTHGMREQCREEVARLGKMFASYAGFWQAWAACLATEQGQEDTASIIRFLAAHFVSGPLNLHDVLNRGLASIMQEKQANKPEQPAAKDAESDGAAEFAAHTDEMLEDLDAELEEPARQPEKAEAAEPELAIGDADPAEEMLPAEEPAAPQAEEELAIGDVDPVAEMLPAEEPAAPQAEEELAIGNVDPAAEMLPAEEPARPQAEEELAIGDVDPVAEMLPAEEPAAPQAEEELAIGDVDPVAEMPPAEEPVTPQAEEEPAIGDVDSAAEMLPAEEPADAAKAEADLLATMELPDMEREEQHAGDFVEEESFSLRTRSMAEVLAEQGDIQGALDIYQELAAAATNDDEAEDIKRRIATLSAKLHVASAAPAFKAADAEAASKSKEKLIGMLEALAERVEARAEG